MRNNENGPQNPAKMAGKKDRLHGTVLFIDAYLMLRC